MEYESNEYGKNYRKITIYVQDNNNNEANQKFVESNRLKVKSRFFCGKFLEWDSTNKDTLAMKHSNNSKLRMKAMSYL